MEVNPLLIEQLPEHQILREDDHMLRSSSYFQIHPCNFQFSLYDHGTQALKDKYHIGKNLYRYFNKRNFLFSRFEMGIAIDEESWYSVIPEAVSEHLKQRFQAMGVKKIFEPFCGVGGIAVHLCDHFEEYIVNDIEPYKLRMMQKNMKVYNKPMNRIKIINQDFLAVEPFQTDALIICPPWGGINTQDYAKEDPDTLMKPKLTDILLHAQRFSKEILLQMPKQTNIGKLIRIFKKVGLAPVFTIEKIMTNGKCSQLFFYLGHEDFIRVEKCQLYSQLYKDLRVEDKEGKKQAKKMLKNAPGTILDQIYQSLYPNRKLKLAEQEKTPSE